LNFFLQLFYLIRSSPV